jgi:pimeloyl-ACP methyl ester carboxylesterase
MTTHVISADGTRIAFDRLGDGPPLIVIGGILCDRATTRPLAERLSEHFTVLNFDRRGRGDSGGTTPYSVQREIEDIAALISHVGVRSAVYGHSSGAGLALHAAATGLPITRLVLHEPPYDDDEDSRRGARELGESIRKATTEDHPADAIRLFFEPTGMPQEMVDEIAADPRTQAMAPTMLHDFEVMDDFTTGGAIPEDLVHAVTVPTLVIAGEDSPDFFRKTATRITELLPNGRQTVLKGADHGAPAEVVAPAVTAFLT